MTDETTNDARERVSADLRSWFKAQSRFRTYKAVADHLGLKDSTLRHYFEGHTLPRGEAARKLHDLTGVSGLSPSPGFFHGGTTADLSDVLGSEGPRTRDSGLEVSPREPAGSGQAMLLNREFGEIKPYKTLRLAVSGDVALTKLEVDLIDTRVFQRLHAIKQLGTSYLVYPSAKHSRFEHSIGTLHEAAEMVRRIRENPKSQREQSDISTEHEVLIRLAALLHDVTHVPFGHTLEDETNVLPIRHDEHEDRRRELLVESDIGKKLVTEIGRQQVGLLMTIMKAKHKEVSELGEYAYISDVVNNTVCADLLDYLKRDVYFCNLQHSFGDRFLNYLYLDDLSKPTDPHVRRLVIRLWKKDGFRHRRDILSELVDLLRVRYYLGEKVYFHHAKTSSSAMVARAVWAAMHPSAGTALSEQDFWGIGDDELLARLEFSQDPIAANLAAQLKKRELHKLTFTLTRSEANAAPGVNWPQKMVDEYNADPRNRTAIEDQLADLCGLKAGEVLIYCPDLDMASKYARMLVAWKDEFKELQEVDDPATALALQSILESHKLLWGVHVFVSARAAENQKTLQSIRDFCRWKFAPAAPADSARQLESTLRTIVNDRMGDRGSPRKADLVVDRLVSKHRSADRDLTSDQVDAAISEILDELERPL